MENNYKNREMFFGQYIGQEVFCDTSEPLEKVTYQTLLSYVGDMSNSSFIKLKLVSEISDNDAIDFFDIVWSKVGTHKDKPKEFKIDFGKDWAMSPFNERYGLIPTGLFQGVDFLRSKNYALPYMGLSIDTLISYGWVVLE